MRLAATVAVLLPVVTLTACGGGSHSAPTTPGTEPAEYSATAPLVEAPAPVPAPPAADERVIRRWADTLRGGDVAGAARLFALPAVTEIAPGSPVIELRTRAQVRAFNDGLPCGARLVQATRERGQGEAGLTVGVFRLTKRSGATCDGTDATARVGFAIDHGRITRWIRLADTPSADAA